MTHAFYAPLFSWNGQTTFALGIIANPCKYFQIGTCPLSAVHCNFVHVLSSTMPPGSARRCRFFEAGCCRYGNACRYQHDPVHYVSFTGNVLCRSAWVCIRFSSLMLEGNYMPTPCTIIAKHSIPTRTDLLLLRRCNSHIPRTSEHSSLPCHVSTPILVV